MAETSTSLIFRMLFFMGIFQTGFVAQGKINRVCRLGKSLCDLKQSPHIWFGKFSQVIEKFGMQKSKFDHPVSYKNYEAGIILLVVYVDDSHYWE